ncbi:transposase [Chryseobacterium sp. EO14]|uniref:transposase n=1 Tax=Chryseobacterium sp. EO14 TaxID=2950551 RepID=UPI00210D8E96|nr:transposase [Chryseobacterium sp. EO14]MCQ4139548.1 transposase [Chryseobacterium sp. EO14]
MTRFLFLSAILFAASGYSQTNCDVLKKENEALQSTGKVLLSENEYLKKVLDINKPILETENENSTFKITKVTGNKTGKNIEITFLVEAKDENKKMTIEDISFVDIEGIEYKIDLFKSSKTFPQLAKDIPLKLTFSFKDIQGEPMFIKIFRFKTTSQPEINSFEKIRSGLEFKDLKVNWN